MPNITITIPEGNALENQTRAQIVQALAHLPIEDVDRIGQLVNSPGARAALKKNWALLKTMFK